MSWQLRNVFARYRGAPQWALENVTCDLAGGTLTALIGPNGAGKSTLARAILGTLPIASGTVNLDGRSLANWDRRELALRVAVLPQGEDETFAMTARDIVAMGRYPHLGPWRGEGTTDRDTIDAAMRSCGVAHLARKPIRSLSGGERQRVRIARAVAQTSHALVLDEPTANLDLRFEMEIFELTRSLARAGRTVIVITHNVNLAARYANSILLLHEGKLVAAGAPAAVMNAPLLEQVFGWPVRIHPHNGPGADSGAPQLVALAGEPGCTAAVTDNNQMRGFDHAGVKQ